MTDTPPAPDGRIDELATKWAAGATSGSDYHRALRACSDQVLGVITDPQMGLAL